MQQRVKLSSIIKDVINETIKQDMWRTAQEERRRQQQFSELDEADDDELFDDGEEDSKGSTKTLDDEKDKLSKGEISTDDIVDRLNSIRAGHSFRDEKIASQLDEYVESLTKAEKVALLAYLKGISQIVSGEFTGEEAMEPGDNPASVAMKKKNAQQKKTIKPNIIKKPMKDEEESKKKPPAEDTSGPVPIKPKK